MTNEIKEILEFKENADYKRLSVDEIVILEDYITNLQEENKKYQNDYENLLILGLKQETHFNIKCDDLQQRIDKAVEYIRINKCNNNDINDCWHEDFKDILDILKGDK